MRGMFLKIGLACLVFTAPVAQATMVLNTSRVIIQNGKNESSFGIRNLDPRNQFLAQSWLTPAFADDTVEHFSLTPQLVQVNGGAEQLVRILYEGVGLPQDRESMLWLNVQEIPKIGEETTAMRFSVLQRIKVFYRPKEIQGSSLAANSGIEWKLDQGKLHVSNPSMFHVTVIDLSLSGKSLMDALVLPPDSMKDISLSNEQQAALRNNQAIKYSTVNDYGAHDRYQTTLIEGNPQKGVNQ